MKFHGTTGSREVCIRFFDTENNDVFDGETWVVLNAANRVSLTSTGLDCMIDHGREGTPIEKAFLFNVERVEFTNEQVDAHPESSKFGKEQWQLVKVFGKNP